MAVAVTDAPEATEDESQFRIEATGALREPRTRILKHGETFGVLNQFGDMVGEPGSPDGLYHQDTRFLSQLELRLNGDRPLLLSSNPAEDGSVLPVDLANTDTIAADGSEVQRREIMDPPRVDELRMAVDLVGTPEHERGEEVDRSAAAD